MLVIFFAFVCCKRRVRTGILYDFSPTYGPVKSYMHLTRVWTLCLPVSVALTSCPFACLDAVSMQVPWKRFLFPPMRLAFLCPGDLVWRNVIPCSLFVQLGRMFWSSFLHGHLYSVSDVALVSSPFAQFVVVRLSTFDCLSSSHIYFEEIRPAPKPSQTTWTSVHADALVAYAVLLGISLSTGGKTVLQSPERPQEEVLYQITPIYGVRPY